MRFLYPFGLVDSTFDLVVGAFKGGFILCPHCQDDLNRLVQTLQAFACIWIGVAIGTIFFLIPARTNAKIEATMTEYINSAGHLREKRRIAITVTGHHLTKTHAFRVASQGGSADPAFESHFLSGK